MKLEKTTTISKIDWVYLSVIAVLLLNIVAFYMVPIKEDEPITVHNIVEGSGKGTEQLDDTADYDDGDTGLLTIADVEQEFASNINYSNPSFSSSSSSSKSSTAKKSSSSSSSSGKSTTSKAKAEPTLKKGERVNLNTASFERLQLLNGVGPVMAQKIIDARPFMTIADFDNVSGVGPATLEKLLPYITVK